MGAVYVPLSGPLPDWILGAVLQGCRQYLVLRAQLCSSSRFSARTRHRLDVGAALLSLLSVRHWEQSGTRHGISGRALDSGRRCLEGSVFSRRFPSKKSGFVFSSYWSLHFRLSSAAVSGESAAISCS